MSGFHIQHAAKQREADDLDLQVFRCIGALLQFAYDHKSKEVRQFGMALGGVRKHIRKHMHPAKQKETA